MKLLRQPDAGAGQYGSSGAAQAPAAMQTASRSTLAGIGREDVVLRRHRGVARVAALAASLAGNGVNVSVAASFENCGESPAVGFRKSLAIFLDERHRFQRVRHHDGIGGLGVLLRRATRSSRSWSPREILAVAGDAAPVGLDHRRVRRDHLQAGFGLADRDGLPVLVSLELGEAKPFGTFSVDRSCAASAMPPAAATDATTIAMAVMFLLSRIRIVEMRDMMKPPHVRPGAVPARLKKWSALLSMTSSRPQKAKKENVRLR